MRADDHGNHHWDGTEIGSVNGSRDLSVAHGIYRFTRNPIYLGPIIVFIGLAVYAASAYGFLAMLAQIPIFLFRIKLEETLLAEYFGDEYETYRNTTKRLIPFLY